MRTALLLLSIPLLAAGAVPLERYNEGVADLTEGRLDDAVAAFEEASVGGEGKLKASATLNLAVCHARRGDEIVAREVEEETREQRVERLGRAAESYRRSLALFRRVPPPAPDAEQGVRAAKVRLLAALDEIATLLEEAKREAEEEALKDPPALLLRTLTEERDRRRAASRLGALDRRRRRIPAHRLRASEYDARALLTKLAAALESPGPSAPAAPGVPASPPPELLARAAEPVKRAVARMEEVEGLLAGLDVAAAVATQTRAIEELRVAAVILPAPLGSLVGKLIDDQRTLGDLTRAKLPGLLPAEQPEIGFWLELLTRLPDPPEASGAKTAITPEAVAKIRTLAAEAAAASGRAAAELLAGRNEEAVPDQEVVLAKLLEIAKLMPRPPESPAERIARLLEEEREVRKGVDALPGMNPEARAEEERALADGQRGRGREAGSIAEELAGSPGEKEKAAAEKVREAEAEIFSSAESLARDRVGSAGEAVDRAIAALEEALAILRGDQQQEQQQGDQGQDGKREEGEEPERQDARKLDARQARRMMEEMDRERRDEEEKIFRGVTGPKVDKDW